jgi:magnesium-transporting ATPase (P-type)
MADKPKISHFVAASDSPTPAPGSARVNDPDRSRLGQLYPQPKTYEQIKQESNKRQVTFRSRWPKYPYLNIAAYGSAVFGLMTWFGQGLNNWWLGSNNGGATMSAVFFSFAIWIVLAVLVMAWVRYVNSLFSYFGGPIWLFWIIYAVVVAVLVTVSVYGVMQGYAPILWSLFVIVIHFGIVLFGTRRVIGRAL